MKPEPRDALLVVDVQNDFCPGGALAIDAAEAIFTPLDAAIRAFEGAGRSVYASRDWHPKKHPSFASEGGRWPEHCVQDTPGAAFHDRLRLPDDAVVVTKGTRFDHDQYSAFDETGLAERLEKDGVERLFVAGLALDVCVEASALDARKAGLQVVILQDATRPVTGEGGDRALKSLQAAGALLSTTGAR